MSKIHASLKSASEDKENDAIGKSVPTFGVDPRVIVVEAGFNARPIYPEHVAYLKGLIVAGVDVDHVKLQMVDGVPTMRDGHHRLAAFMELIAEGNDIKRIKAIEFKGDEKAARYMMLGTQSGLKYTPAQLGDQYKILMNTFGDSYAEIAKARGMSTQHVKDMIRLCEQPVELKAMIADGTVSAATALKLVKKEGAKAATATIKEGIQTGKKGPITQKVIDNLAKNVVPEAVKRTTAAREHVEAMLDSPAFDGPTKSVLNDALSIISGKVQRIAPAARVDSLPILREWLGQQKESGHSDVQRAAYLLFDIAGGAKPPEDTSGGAQFYSFMVWLQDMAANSKEPNFRAASHWFMAVLNAKRSGVELAPAPQVLSFEDALRAEMQSGGATLAEHLCPEQAALIAWARGRA
jgi:hypothetical protein